jgi:hypothetical protein
VSRIVLARQLVVSLEVVVKPGISMRCEFTTVVVIMFGGRQYKFCWLPNILYFR